MVVSVIIPVYNERKYLYDCLNSVLNQTYRDIEIVIVDDGSNNGAGDDCDTFAQGKLNVKVIHKQNEGLSAARITGIENSCGDWLMFMDHDDILAPDAVENFLNYVSDGVDIIGGGRIDTSKPEDVQWVRSLDRVHLLEEGRSIAERIPRDQQEYIVTPLWGKIFRSSFLKNSNLERYKTICPTIFFEDLLMTPILFNEARLVCILKDKYYIHREIDTSISHSGKLSNYYYEQLDSGVKLINYCKQNRMPQFYKYEIALYTHSIIRIYSLMHFYLDEGQQSIYRKSISDNCRKYFFASFFNKYSTLSTRMELFLFMISPRMVRVIYSKYIRK